MFWKRTKGPAQQAQPIAESLKPVEQAGLTDPLEQAAQNLATSLREYAHAAYEGRKEVSDSGLKAAEAMVDAARKVVEGGRIAYALGRCLPDHIAHWHAWSLRPDFSKWVGFDASEITANRVTKEEQGRRVEVTSTEFMFNGSKYQIVLKDRGMSPVPDELLMLGEVSLLAADHCVARFELIQDVSKDYTEWVYSDVRALKVGPWMRDVLDMAAQVDASRQNRSAKLQEERVRDAAREIDLS